jgi:hypothetical protein
MCAEYEQEREAQGQAKCQEVQVQSTGCMHL